MLMHIDRLGLWDFRAYPVDLIQRVETARDYDLLPAGREVTDLVRSSRPAKAWTVSLPPTRDFKMPQSLALRIHLRSPTHA